MIITFFGHRSLKIDGLLEKIERAIDDNIDFEGDTVFYCGGYGDFDNLCVQACNSIKKKRGNCEIVYVTPYLTEAHQRNMRDLTKSGLYDSIEYPPLEGVPLKFAINKRNEWMIDQSDLTIAYVEHSFGGAYNGLKRARRKKKRVINLAKNE